MLSEQTKQVRKHLAAGRSVERNMRLGRYDGRNSDATALTLDWHFSQAAALDKQLPREVRGLLWAENDLCTRLSEARDDGKDRPELRDRLSRLRRRLNAAEEA